MKQRYSNVSNVPLSLAVFLASDFYDHDDDPNTISATALIKPIRQTILASRVPMEDASVDLTQMIASRMGSAIHDGIDKAWKTNHGPAMKSLGIPGRVADQIIINPDHDMCLEDKIPVYMERRMYRDFGKYTISGKPDFIGEGRVEDFKTTSTYSAMSGSNDENYILQGSIYRWLDPKIITQDQMSIQFLFTDWSAMRAKQDPKYPQHRFMSRTFDLLSLAQTEQFIATRLSDYEKYKDAPEETIPHCTDKELWRSDPVYRYYKNPANTGRSTKNFDSRQDALVRLAADGNVGIIREQPGQVRACLYCPAFAACTQKDALIASGDLTV